MRIAIKIGGSLAIKEDGPDEKYFKKFIPVFRKIKKESKKIVVGIGGGKLVRNYYKRTTKFLSPREQEMIAIDLLRANARFLAYILGGKPVFSLSKLPRSKVLVVSGIKPGRSTDANTAILASKIKAHKLIILTDVDGIYTKDPKKYSNARLIRKIRFKDLMQYSKKKVSPGNYGVVDPLALKIISKFKINTFVMNGTNPRNILRVLNGERIGTEISF